MGKQDSFEALEALGLPEGAVILIERHGHPYLYAHDGRGEWSDVSLSGVELDKDWLSWGFRVVYPTPSRADIIKKFSEAVKERAEEWDSDEFSADWDYTTEANGLGRLLAEILEEEGL